MNRNYLVTCIVAGAVFACLAVIVGTGSQPVWDRLVLEQLHSWGSVNQDAFWIAVTRTGGLHGVATILCGVLLLLVLRRQLTAALFLAVSYLGAEICHVSIKQIFARERPALWASPAPEYTYSFPSGHALVSAAVMFALIVVLEKSLWRWVVTVAGIVFVGLVGISRSYLGVHYPSDVLASWSLALGWIALLVLAGRAGDGRSPGPPRFCCKPLLGLLALLLVLPLGYAAHAWSTDNFHAVVRGQAYRAGQMSPALLTRTVEHYGIKSILNLRGANPTERWYKGEIAIASNLNVEHFDRRLNSGSELTIEDMDDLVALLRNSPKPILIHCKGGADRSGLVSALYRFALDGGRAKEADRELVLWYGHLPLIWPKVRAMDRSFWRYATNHVGR